MNNTEEHSDYLPSSEGDKNKVQENTLFESRLDLNKVQLGISKLRSEIGKVIVGQDDFIDLLLINFLSKGHSLIEGVPGIAKTVMAKLFAKCLDLSFSRIQFTPDLMPSDVLGTSLFNQKKGDFEFKPGPIFAKIVLIDEINRSPAKTQSALFEAMAEGQISVDGETYVLEAPFLVLATQNPIEQEGTYRLPEAQLDRFLFKIEVGYPSLEEEIKILERKNENKLETEKSDVEKIFSKEEILELQTITEKVTVESKLIRYIAELIQNTRENPFLFLGASPRASIAILSASKSAAIIAGRDFVTPEDIKFVVPPVLKHRVMVNPEKEMEGINSEQVIHQILESLEVPR